MDAADAGDPPTSPTPPCFFRITAIFNNDKLLSNEHFGPRVFNFHSGRHLSVCRGSNLWSGSGTGGFRNVGRRRQLTRHFPFLHLGSPIFDVASVALLLRGVAWHTHFKRKCRVFFFFFQKKWEKTDLCTYLIFQRWKRC